MSHDSINIAFYNGNASRSGRTRLATFKQQNIINTFEDRNQGDTLEPSQPSITFEHR